MKLAARDGNHSGKARPVITSHYDTKPAIVRSIFQLKLVLWIEQSLSMKPDMPSSRHKFQVPISTATRRSQTHLALPFDPSTSA